LIKAPDDANGNPQAFEQYNGSGGPHLVSLHHGDINPATGQMDRIHNIDNLYGINDTNGQPMGANNPAGASQFSPTTHIQNVSEASTAADALRLSASRYMNSGIAPQYVKLQEDTTPQSDLMTQVAKSGGPFSKVATDRSDLLKSVLTDVRNTAADQGVRGLSDATVMALAQRYGAVKPAGLFKPGSFVYNFGADSIGIDDPKGLATDLQQMKDPDALGKRNEQATRALSIAAGVNDPNNPNSAIANETNAYKAMVAQHNAKATDHPGYDTTKVDLQYKAASAELARRKAGLDAMSKVMGSVPSVFDLPVPKPPGRPGPAVPVPSVPSPTATSSDPSITPPSATAALAAAMAGR
jgi:hypothetical protein